MKITKLATKTEYEVLSKLIGECISIIENSQPTRERSLVKTKLEEAILWLQQDNNKFFAHE